MKKFRPASPIIRAATILSAVWFLSACDMLEQDFSYDQVPQEVKDQPRLVGSPPPRSDDDPWPKLGAVPAKPKDFSPKPVYDHYMDELTDDRGLAKDAKKEVEESEPPPMPPAEDMPHNSPAGDALSPPQLPH